MTVELACRLLESKVLLRTEVAASLLDASSRGIALVQSLIDRVPGALGIIESEFARWPGPIQTALNVDERLFSALPLGMCERLLALPLVGRDPSGKILLAVVDPYDSHVPAEFEYCLSAAVTSVRVGYMVLLQTLDSVRTAGTSPMDMLLDVADDETPAFGTRMLRVSRRPKAHEPHAPLEAGSGKERGRRGITVPSVELPEPASDPPIPLVRTTIAPGLLNQGFESASAQGLPRRDSEPVLRLVKQKPVTPLRRVSVPPPPRFAEQGVEQPEAVLASLETASSPRHLIELMRGALQRLAPCQAYFSVRSGRYALEWASGVELPQKTVLTLEQEALFGKACQAGYFLGPLPPDGEQRALGATLDLRAREEIYVVPVQVVNRPALVVAVGRFDEAFSVTRWVDSVVSRASQVLDRLARNRKQT